MKSSDRLLVGIIAGIVLLVVIALVVTLTQEPPEYLPEDTPGGIVNNYLLALQNKDYERAYGYLSRQLRCYPATLAEFTSEVPSSGYLYGSGGRSSSWAIEQATVRRLTATVTVAETRWSGGDLFSGGQDFYRFEVDLILEDDGWRISEADRYFNTWRWTGSNCD